MLLSVVIASHNAASVIEQCLAALRDQETPESMEVIVADSSADGTAEFVQEFFPNVRLLRFSEPLTIPYLRGAGIAGARGEIIAVLDPYCMVTDDWVTELLRLHAERPELVIGGAVSLENPGRASLVNWATYFCEYGAFMLPLKSETVDELAGNNIAYKRRALDGAAAGHDGFWKTFLNRRLQAEGHQLWCAPSLVVRLRKPIPFMEFFGSRYHHGRCFAAMRVVAAPWYERWLRAVTTPVLPYLSLWRQARSVWPKHRHRIRFALAVPLLFLFDCSWAWGELWGYLRGRHKSCDKLLY